MPNSSESELPSTERKRVTLPSYQACRLCRRHKKKCDAALPRCGRCERNDVPCHVQVIPLRRGRIETYQERILSLESQVALISKAHTRDLISQSLWDKLRLLSSPSNPRPELQAPYRPLALWPYATVPVPAIATRSSGTIVNEELEAGYSPAVPKETIIQIVKTWTPAFEGSTLPATFSLWMIRLFLPFRLHFHFSGDPKMLFLAFNRPPEDPQSLHPALLNAIHLAACWIIGRDVDFLKDYFLAQTRYHMGEALRTADRLMHFLWASLILGTFFALEDRMNEAYVTVSSCVELALACGLDVVHYRHRTQLVQNPLLPPPADAAECRDRHTLSRGIYILDRTLAMVYGTPSAFSGANGPFTQPAMDIESDENGVTFSATTEGLRREMEILVQDTGRTPNWETLFIYERIEQLVRQAESLSLTELDERIAVYSQALHAYAPSLPRYWSPWNVDESETWGKITPAIIHGLTNHYGCVMLLYSLKAPTDMEARTKVIGAARTLAELGATIKGKSGVKHAHAVLILMLHLTNAVRVFASYLNTPEVKGSNKLFAMCSESLGMILDVLHDSSAFYPSWTHVLPSLRELFSKVPPNDSPRGL